MHEHLINKNPRLYKYFYLKVALLLEIMEINMFINKYIQYILFAFLFIIFTNTVIVQPANTSSSLDNYWAEKLQMESHGQVRSFQKSLKTLGMYSGETDGLVGPKILDALSELQNIESIDPVGVGDPVLAARLHLARARLLDSSP